MAGSLWALSWDIPRSGGLIHLNYAAFGSIRFPTETEWRDILKKHDDEIQDGERSKEFLDGSFLGGWKRCFEYFVYGGPHDWNYYMLKESQPWYLGGNMVDTDRVAGNKGWEAATQVIESELEQLPEDTVRSRIKTINPRLWLLLLLVTASLMLALIGQVLGMRCRPRRELDGPSIESGN